MGKTDHYRHAPGEYQYREAIRALPRKMFLDAVAKHCPKVMQDLRVTCAAVKNGAALPEIEQAVQKWAQDHHLQDAKRRVPRWIRANARRSVQTWAQWPQIAAFQFATAEMSVTNDQEIAPGTSWDASESTRTQFENGYKASGRRLTKTVRDRLEEIEKLAGVREAVRPPRGWSPEHYGWAVRVLCNGDTPRSLAGELGQLDRVSAIDKAVKVVLDNVGLHRFVPRGRPRLHP